MTDLTAITTPFGLLDTETQEALKAHGGPYELWRGSLWGEAGNASELGEFDGWYTYRVKPAPREFWITIWDGLAWDDQESAETHNKTLKDSAGPIIHVVEKLP
jgi:hypothetical protein